MTYQKRTTTSLFPSAGIISADSAPSENVDWLENKSFTSATAERVVQFQQELKALQKSRNESDDSDEENDDDDGGDYEEFKEKEKELIHTSNNTRTSKATVDTARPFPDTYVRNKKRTSTDECLDDYSSSEDHHYKKRKKQKKHSSSDDDSDRQSKKKKSKHKRKKKHKKEKYKVKESREINIPGMFESSKIFLDDIADIAPDHAFKLDKKPDTNSWCYGSLYSGHVAKYKPACNQCAGSAGNQIVNLIDRDKKKKEKIISDRYYSKENRRIIKQPPVDVICSSKQEFNIQNDIPVYIPVDDLNEIVTAVENKDARQKILDESTSLYVLGKGKQTDEELVEATPDPVRLKVADYNKRLRESPNDVKLWLEFVRFQDKLNIDDSGAIFELDADSGGRKQTAKALLDKKLSILDKALESNPGDIDLFLARVELNSEILDAVQINKELEQLLFVHVANTRLWKYYLSFNQSRLSVFTVSKMTKLYHKCFKTLFRILEGKLQTHSVPDNLDREILGIFLQYCYFLKQAGYKEKALASFQALTEYNLFAPSSVNRVTKETKMAAFEEFWDSTCPKIGTSGGCGWRNWNGQTSSAADSEETSADPLEDLEEEVIEKKLPKHETWLKIEELREKHHWLPWQPGQGQTEEECEDVERLVVFDDISPLLFEISEDLHFDFVVMFLKFLGLDTKSVTKSVCCAQMWGNFSENVNDLTSDYQSCKGENAKTGVINEIVKDFAVGLLKLVIPCFQEKWRSELTQFLIETQLSKYQLENPSKHEKKEMRKILKNVLKEEHNRNDFSVWSMYIDLERSIGKPGEAESVMVTALSMYSGVSIESTNLLTLGLITLFCQYCELLLEIDQILPYKLLPRAAEVTLETKKKVLSVINCLVEGRKFNSREVTELSGAVILRTLSALSKLCSSVCRTLYETQNTRTLELSHEHFIKLQWCLCLFVYCKSGLSASIDIYTSVRSTLSCGDKQIPQVEKRLYQDLLRIILYHMSTSSSPLHVLREHLSTALQKFPEDDVFLSLYVDVERKSRITSRLNAHFDHLSRTAETPIPVLFAILFQLEFLANLKSSDEDASHSSIINRSRAWLEHSLTNSALRHCPLLWRLYLQLENHAGSTGRLKGVFYRAVQQCPWNKCIYVDGVRLFGEEQLQEMVDLMMEKELRVQIPVEELDILMSS